MGRIIELRTYSDHRGNLISLDRELPFQPKRIYYIFGVNPLFPRAGHGHKTNRQILIAIQGSCDVEYVDHTKHTLDSPNKCLLLEPSDWHILNNFTENCILLVLASEHYDVDDYIDDPSLISQTEN